MGVTCIFRSGQMDQMNLRVNILSTSIWTQNVLSRVFVGDGEDRSDLCPLVHKSLNSPNEAGVPVTDYQIICFLQVFYHNRAG